MHYLVSVCVTSAISITFFGLHLWSRRKPNREDWWGLAFPTSMAAWAVVMWTDGHTFAYSNVVHVCAFIIYLAALVYWLRDNQKQAAKAQFPPEHGSVNE